LADCPSVLWAKGNEPEDFEMDTTLNAAVMPLPTPRSERFPGLMGCTTTVALILLGVDLRAFAWGGLWLRAILQVRI
jgi:hypothetical protein